MKKTNSSTKSYWEWTGGFIQLAPEGQLIAQRHYVVEIPAILLYPLSPETVVRSRKSSIESEKRKYLTCRIDEDQLTDVLNDAWSMLAPDSEQILQNLYMLPSIEYDKIELAYIDDTENPSLFIKDLPEHLCASEALGADAKIKCRLCNVELKHKDMTPHVGGHILRAARGLKDMMLPEGVEIGPNPCGFCGEDGCVTTMTFHKRKQRVIQSSCPYRYKNMDYKAAATGSQTTRCTNVSIHCLFPGCSSSMTRTPQTIWKYNALYHIMTEHANDDGTPPAILPPMMIHIFIRKVEEMAVTGVKEDNVDLWRSEDFNLNSKGFEAILAEEEKVAPPSKKRRGRHGTVTKHREADPEKS